MARHPWLDPAPFNLDGGPVGVLLIHGFTGAPAEMRPFADFLAGQGHAAAGCLLPGHGTRPEDLNRVSWRDWTEAVAMAFRDLADRMEQVFVVGHSLGGLLALHLAAHQPAVAVSGLILSAPGLRLKERLLPLSVLLRYVQPLRPKDFSAEIADQIDPQAGDRIWCYDSNPVGGASQLWRLQREVRRTLPRVSQPLIIFQGRRDRAVRPDSPETILARVGSSDVQVVWLDHSGHDLLVDAQRDEIFQAAGAWIRNRKGRHQPNRP